MPDDEDVRTLLSSATLVIVGTVLRSVSGLVERVILGRVLGPTEYGVISVCLAVMTLAATASMFGLTQGIPRYMSRFDVRSERRGVWVSGGLVSGTVAVVVAGILLLFSERLAVLLLDSRAYTTPLRIFLLTVPFLTLFKITISGIRGEENTIYRTYAQDLLYPVLRIGLLGALFVLGATVVAPSLAYLGGVIAATGVALYFLNELFSLRGSVDWRILELTRFSAPLIVSMIMSILLTRTDTIMIGYFRTSTEAGLYGAAYPIAAGLQLVLSSFGFLYLPLASRLDAEDSRDEVAEVYKLTTKWIYIITFPAFVVFLLFSTEVLSLFWGPDFAKAGIALSILSLGFFSSAAVGRNRETISAFGYTRYIMYANLLGFTANLLLNLYLIPEFGYVGASVSSAFSFVLLNSYIYVVLKRRFDVTPLSAYSTKTFAALPLVVLPVAGVIERTTDVSGVAALTLLPMLGILSLVIVAVVGGLQPEDELVVSFVEDRLSTEIPYVRNWINEP